MMARPRGWTREAQELQEMTEDVAFTVRAMLLFLGRVLAGTASPQERLAVEVRAALLGPLCGRVQRALGLRSRRLDRRRRALREVASQLRLPLAWA